MPPMVAQRWRGGDVGSEPEPERRELRVQFIQHDPRLDADPAFLRVHLQHAVVKLGQIHLKALADRLAGLRSTASAHGQRASKTVAGTDGPEDVFAIPGNDDPEGLDLINARVGRVERAGDGVETHFPLDLAFEFAPQTFHVHQAYVRLRYRRSSPYLHQAQWADSAISVRPLCSRSSPRASVSPPLAKETRSVPSPPGP